MPMNALDRDQFLGRVKPVNLTLTDREFAWYVANLPTAFEGSLADMRFNGTKGWVDSAGPGNGQAAIGLQLLLGADVWYKPGEMLSDGTYPNGNPRWLANIGRNRTAPRETAAWAGGNVVTPTTNDPVYLPFEGFKYIYNPRDPALVPNDITTPHRAALVLSTDIDIRFKVKRPTWSPGASNWCLAGRQTGGILQFTASVYIDTFYWYQGNPTGSGWLTPLTALATSLPTNQWILLRFTATRSTGARTIQWSSNNGASWTVLAQDTGFANNFPANTGPISVAGVGAETWGASFAWCEIRTAIDGPIVSKFDANLSAQSGYSSTYGDVWTVNHNGTAPACLVEKNCYYLTTDDLFLTSSSPYFACPNPQSFTMVCAYRNWTDVSGTPSYMTLVDTAITKTLGNLWAYGADQSHNFQVYSGGNSGALRATPGTRSVIVGVKDFPNNLVISYVNGNTAYTASGMGTNDEQAAILTLGAGYFGGYSNMEFFGAAFFKSALSPSAVAAVTAAMNE